MRFLLCSLAAWIGCAVWSTCVTSAAESTAEENRWEAAIVAFEKEDAASPPPKGALLFVGSSSIRLWDLDKFFPDQTTLNRGFGGSQIIDSLHFAKRIVLPYEPRAIVMYAGDNDVAAGKSAKVVAADFQRFAKLIRTKLPETDLIFVAIKPSIKRWALTAEMAKANKMIDAYCGQDDRLHFLDIHAPMLGADGRPRPDLFVDDGLHLNENGYRLWTRLLLPMLREIDQAEIDKPSHN